MNKIDPIEIYRGPKTYILSKMVFNFLSVDIPEKLAEEKAKEIATHAFDLIKREVEGFQQALEEQEPDIGVTDPSDSQYG